MSHRQGLHVQNLVGGGSRNSHTSSGTTRATTTAESGNFEPSTRAAMGNEMYQKCVQQSCLGSQEVCNNKKMHVQRKNAACAVKKPNTKSACAMKSRKGGAACAKKREGKEALHVQRKKMHSDMAALHWKAFVKLTRKYWLHCRSRNLSRGTTRTTLKPNM